jgi:hypothetical protein
MAPFAWVRNIPKKPVAAFSAALRLKLLMRIVPVPQLVSDIVAVLLPEYINVQVPPDESGPSH